MDAFKSMEFKYFTAHALINYLNNFALYRHILKWICLGKPLAASLRKYFQVQLMFLIYDSASCYNGNKQGSKKHTVYRKEHKEKAVTKSDMSIICKIYSTKITIF